MKYGFSLYLTEVEGHTFWVAESKDLKGCVGQADTADAAIKELEQNEIEWLEAAEEYSITIPEPTLEKNNYSGKFMTRISPKVHQLAAENAKTQGISLNQYVNDAIVAWNTEGQLLPQLQKHHSKILKAKKIV